MPKIVHNLIADTARDIAREAYESVAHSNDFYAQWPDREAFVKANFSMFVDGARAALLEILKGDYPDAMKDPIYEALVIDGSYRKQANASPVRTKVAGRVFH